jgi:hypothetical protein
VKTAVFNKETVADAARWIGVDGFACAAAWLMWMSHVSAGMRRLHSKAILSLRES